MTCLVAYSSQTGFTQKYAEWIAEDLSCEAVSIDRRSRVEVSDFDVVVFGGAFHGPTFGGMKWLQQQRAAHPSVRFVVFAVGATPAAWDEMVNEAMTHTFASPEFDDVLRFYMQGGFDYEKLALPGKALIRMFYKMQEKQAQSDPRAAEMLAQMRAGFDATDRAAIDPLVACVRSQ